MSAARADRVEQALRERELDALIVTHMVNVRWLTGFTGTNAAAVVGADGRRIFVTDFRYTEQAEAEVDGFELQRGKQDLLGDVSKSLSGMVGFEDAHVSVRSWRRLEELVPEAGELTAAGSLVEALRMVKEPAELDAVRSAASLADEVLEEVVMKGGLAGRTELDVARGLLAAMRERGSEPSFPPIVAAGAHGALPHAQPRDVEIPKDTLVVIDWGAASGGYCSDCTRTLATGTVSDGAREIYELVERAQLESLAAVVPGANGKEVDGIARTIIGDAGHADHFGHGLGHGVGLEVHEEPRLTQLADSTLQAGNVVTVEPGVYVPGEIGVRIEDLVILTEDGQEVVSGLPKGLTEV